MLRLTDNVASPQDLSTLELELKDYSRWFAHNAIKERVHAQHSATAAPPPTLTPTALELIRDFCGKKLLDQTQLEKLVLEIEKYKKTAPLITITLAAPAPKKLRHELVAWCRANLAPNVLIDFHFNGGLLGGMVVRSGSRIFDLSLKRQLMENRARFPEVLKRA